MVRIITCWCLARYTQWVLLPPGGGGEGPPGPVPPEAEVSRNFGSTRVCPLSVLCVVCASCTAMYHLSVLCVVLCLCTTCPCQYNSPSLHFDMCRLCNSLQHNAATTLTHGPGALVCFLLHDCRPCLTPF
jgi:hypothetical protein